MNLSEQVAALEARLVFDEECVHLLMKVKHRVWAEARYDPYSDATQKFAAGLMDDLQALVDRLKIKH
jgi:hypothetical protein